MLVLTRKLMEKLFIGDDICVTVVRLEGGQVRLGIEAPREVAVVRAELVPERQLPGSKGRTSKSRAVVKVRHQALDQPRFMKSITDAADGFDELTGVPELLPQALDVHVDGPLQHDRVLANRGIHQLIAGEGPACLPDQDFQQPELGRRQR